MTLPEATLVGLMGKAWRIPAPAPEDRGMPENAASLVCFLVEARGYHPYWWRWSVNVCHLRDVPGQRHPAHKLSPEMTHEFQIQSLDPDKYAAQDDHFPDMRGCWGFLSPPDVMEQFVASADQIAARIGELAVRTIVDGVASPDQDHRRVWTSLIQTTAEHFRDGRHGIA